MIIGIGEAGEVRIYRDLADVMTEWGSHPRDLLSEVIRLYTDERKFLVPSPVYAKKKWYQLRPSLIKVTFQERNPKDVGQDELGYLLQHEVAALRSNDHVASLDALRVRFPSRS